MAAGVGFSQNVSQGKEASREEKRVEILKRFPESDANQDGTLTHEEVLAFFRKRKGGPREVASRTARPRESESATKARADRRQCALWRT